MGKSIESIASALGVNVADVECLLNSVVGEIKKDKLSDHFVNESTEEGRVEITQAYVAHAVKKFESFTNQYLSNPEKKESFDKDVLANIGNA